MTDTRDGLFSFFENLNSTTKAKGNEVERIERWLCSMPAPDQGRALFSNNDVMPEQGLQDFAGKDLESCISVLKELRSHTVQNESDVNIERQIGDIHSWLTSFRAEARITLWTRAEELKEMVQRLSDRLLCVLKDGETSLKGAKIDRISLGRAGSSVTEIEELHGNENATRAEFTDAAASVSSNSDSESSCSESSVRFTEEFENRSLSDKLVARIVKRAQVHVDSLMELLPAMELMLDQLNMSNMAAPEAEFIEPTRSAHELLGLGSAGENIEVHNLVSLGEAWPYYSKVKDAFSTAPDYLAEKVAKLNWERHISLRGGEVPFQSTEPAAFAPALTDAMPLTSGKARTEITRDSGYVGSEEINSSGLRLGEYMETASSGSFQSYKTSETSLRRGAPRVPAPPAGFFSNESFTCFICNRKQDNIHTRHAWKRHVFSDIKPYFCTRPYCKETSVFRTRNQWIEHESTHNLIGTIYADEDTIVKLEEQSDLGAGHSPSKLHTFRPKNQNQPGMKHEHENCPFCNKRISNTEKSYKSHVGHHFEEFALSAFPRELQMDEDSASESGSVENTIATSDLLQTLLRPIAVDDGLIDEQWLKTMFATITPEPPLNNIKGHTPTPSNFPAKPEYLCPHDGCDRRRRPFSRKVNLQAHLRAVHGDTIPRIRAYRKTSRGMSRQ